MAGAKKKRLGKGLSAMISDTARPLDVAEPHPEGEAAAEEDRILRLDPRDLEPNPMQPRREFDEEALGELCESIKRDGIQEPVIVRRRGAGYELVSGERRVRAAVMADLETVPAVCRDVSDKDMLKLGLIENIQREDLNAVELAMAYQSLIEEFGWTQEQLADEVGKKRATVTNTLRLLHLPEDVQRAVAGGAISMGHARALLALEKPRDQRQACQKIIRDGLSVRQAEKLASPKPPKEPSSPPPKDPNLTALEDELRSKLGTKVALRETGKNRGRIEIEYFNLDDLERLLDLLRNSQ